MRWDGDALIGCQLPLSGPLLRHRASLSVATPTGVPQRSPGLHQGFNSGSYPICSVAGSRVGADTTGARTVPAKSDREAVRTDPARPAPAAEFLDTTLSTGSIHRLRHHLHATGHHILSRVVLRVRMSRDWQRPRGRRRQSSAQCAIEVRAVECERFVLHHDGGFGSQRRVKALDRLVGQMADLSVVCGEAHRPVN